MSAEKPDRSDLREFGLMAEEHWRKYRPRMFKSMKKKGTLYTRLYEAQKCAGDLIADLEPKLMKQGHSPGQAYMTAREPALNDFILMPAESDEY